MQEMRLKLQLNFRITCIVATEVTSNEGQAMHNIIFPDEFSGYFHNSAVHGTAQMQEIRLKLQLNFRITCIVATQVTSNEGQAMHNIIFPDEFSMQ